MARNVQYVSILNSFKIPFGSKMYHVIYLLRYRIIELLIMYMHKCEMTERYSVGRRGLCVINNFKLFELPFCDNNNKH